MALEKGLSAEVTRKVAPDMTARAIGSGDVSGLATPWMIALMEAAAVKAVAGRMEEGRTSVGTHLEVSHSAPTPEGMSVTARAELTHVSGRELIFSVSAHDEEGPIGQGSHRRVVVGFDSFETKTAERGHVDPQGGS